MWSLVRRPLAPVGHLCAPRSIFSWLAHVHHEESRVFAGGGLEHVQHTHVHYGPISPGVAETDLDALRGSRLLQDQGDEKTEEGQVVFMDQLEGVFPEDPLLKVARNPLPVAFGLAAPGRGPMWRRPEEVRTNTVPAPPGLSGKLAISPGWISVSSCSLRKPSICVPLAANLSMTPSAARGYPPPTMSLLIARLPSHKKTSLAPGEKNGPKYAGKRPHGGLYRVFREDSVSCLVYCRRVDDSGVP
jgi:hypothetical protein